MNLNPRPQVRQAIYVLSVFANAFYAVLVAQDVYVSVWAVATLAGFNAVVAVMATRNVETK